MGSVKNVSRRTHPVFGLLMTAFTLCWLIPIFGAVYLSMRTQGDLTANGFWSFPRELTLNNYASAWALGHVGIYLGNSFLITIPSLIGTLFLSSLAAFALARYRFRGNLLLYF